MAIVYERLKNFPPKEEDITYTIRDTILYAIGAGLGFDPSDLKQLPFVYERDLVALPTIAMAIGHPGWWLGSAGLEPGRVVHASKRMEVLAPMPIAGTVHTRSIVTGVDDKGPGKGALVHTQRDIWDKKSGVHISRQINTIMARGQGGFGGANTPALPPHPIPERTPDLSCELPTIPQQALIFRLMGDHHPVHVDPVFAKANGFPGTILHGLATMAIATHATLRTVCDYDTNRIKAVQCRFTKPVTPGDLIRTDIWKDGQTISFRSTVAARDAVVIDHGLVELS